MIGTKLILLNCIILISSLLDSGVCLSSINYNTECLEAVRNVFYSFYSNYLFNTFEKDIMTLLVANLTYGLSMEKRMLTDIRRTSQESGKGKGLKV